MTRRRFERILILTPNFLGGDGASSLSRAVIEAVYRRCQLSGEKLKVWSLNESKLDERHSALEGVDYRFANGRKKRFSLWGAGSALRARRTLALVLHPGLAPASIPLEALGGRVIVFLLGIDAWRPMRGLDALALSSADRLVAISHYTARRFREINPALTNPTVEVCHLCLTLPARAERTVPTAPPFALIVARMAAAERYKGHDELLDIWPDVIRAAPNALLIVTGDGDDRVRLENKARELNLGGHVQFLGRVSDAKLAELYEQCLFFVMPSRDEGFGLVFLEAMRAGKACIGAVGAAEEVIEHDVTGLIVDPAEPSVLHEALIRLLNDGDLRMNMGDAGRRRQAEVFSRERFQERLGEILSLD